MYQVPDRKKLRRDYLKKKGDAYLSGAICTLMFIPAMFVSLICWVISLLILIWGVITVITNPASILPAGFGVLVTLFISIMIAGISSLFAYAMWMGIESAKQVGDIAYVPPVTASSLPAEEILVRGSEEPPVAQSEVLLRAAQGVETPQEELLRVAEE